MAEFLLELFSEEIPARMQSRAAEDLARLVGEALAALSPTQVRRFHGPRRIALAAELATEVPAQSSSERGPRLGAPEAALAGFLRKHRASREQLREAGEYWVLEKQSPAQPAAGLIAAALPGLLRRFPWPKSMRWGGTSQFTWVRPLRRILCLLDGAVVPFDLRDGEDDGHGLASGKLTEGHRFLAPGPVAVGGAAEWEAELRRRRVIVGAAERRERIASGIAALAASRQLSVVDDPGLLDEIAGLAEWPVPLLGRIDAAYMDLPPEVMQVSMRVNQRYVALRQADGSAAPFFAFAADNEAADGGAAIIAGNERVLRARFADARHFWDLDRRVRLADRVPALDTITFHARLGSQGDRVRRLEALAEAVAPSVDADPVLARRAALLAKADLTTGMVGEFPELQGVMGRYYALNDGENSRVADAVRDHYAPKGPGDEAPSEPIAIAAALADKIDLIAGFFSIGEKPTGSGDPYALRRAALGIIRIVRENNLTLALSGPVSHRLEWAGDRDYLDHTQEVLDFIDDRLRIQLRADGLRHDVVRAAIPSRGSSALKLDDDVLRNVERVHALDSLVGSQDGADLLPAYRRAANILRAEEKPDDRYLPLQDSGCLTSPEELALFAKLKVIDEEVRSRFAEGRFRAAMTSLASLRPLVDAFFDRVTVNAPEPDLRRNRLRLLSYLRSTMNLVADFSKIEG